MFLQKLHYNKIMKMQIRLALCKIFYLGHIRRNYIWFNIRRSFVLHAEMQRYLFRGVCDRRLFVETCYIFIVGHCVEPRVFLNSLRDDVKLASQTATGRFSLDVSENMRTTRIESMTREICIFRSRTIRFQTFN